MVNGVLVERVVSDVLPALQTNSDGLKKVLEDLLKQYQTKQTEMETWKVTFNAQIHFCVADADVIHRRRTTSRLFNSEDFLRWSSERGCFSEVFRLVFYPWLCSRRGVRA
jgi:hypothetical protein